MIGNKEASSIISHVEERTYRRSLVIAESGTRAGRLFKQVGVLVAGKLTRTTDHDIDHLRVRFTKEIGM